QLPDALREQIARLTAEVPTAGPLDDLAGKLTRNGAEGVVALNERAKQLEQQAVRLRQLAKDVHHQQVIERLSKMGALPDEKIDLLAAGLLVARLDNDEVDVEAYERQVDRMARELAERLPAGAGEAAKLAELTRLFFT